MDFIALEYVLTSREAAALVRGYNTILPLPDLSVARSIYRYLHRLMEVQGRTQSLDAWMAQPALFVV